MRDGRFTAAHRGGSLSTERHRHLAAWAASCAEHVLPLSCAVSPDGCPRAAIDSARAWVRGEISVGQARKAALAAHAAARQTDSAQAKAAARAAGHAAATAHMADHSLRAAFYALKAVHAAGIPVSAERAWQDACVPDDLRELVASARDVLTRPSSARAAGQTTESR